MSYIKKEKIEEIKEKLDIISVVSDYVSLKKSGRYYMGNCPFHSEKTPSFFLYPETNTFHCFGCGKHGDSISFIMEMDSLDYVSTLKKLAEKFGIELEYDNSFNTNNKKNLDKYYEINEFTARYYYKNMMENSVPKQYLSKRGINQKSINLFFIGYADENWKSLYNELKLKNMDIEIAEELGLIIKTKTGDYIDRFRNRIMFPILNTSKKIIGFGGRTIVDDSAKYLNSPESVVFKKGDNLYALDKIIENNIRNKILIVEGYMDVISLYQSGVNYSVAGLGTAFTESQARLIKRYFRNNVYLCYDGDNAGASATDKTNAVFNEISVKPNIIMLPDKLDPDDYIKKFGLDEFNKLIESPYDINGFNYEILKKNKKNSNSITDNSIFYDSILDFLVKIDTNILRDLYINKISNEFGLDSNSLKEDFLNYDKKEKVVKKKDEETEINYKTENLLLNSDKKVLILGIILLMRCENNVLKIINKLEELSKNSNLFEIFSYVKNNAENNTITVPSVLIDEFKNSIENLKIVEYIVKCYNEKIKLSALDYNRLLDITILNFEIRKTTLNIEKLKQMDKTNESVISNLNYNIEKLMELNRNLKNIEKGVHHE
ncbi:MULTISPECIES: DNA primase [unclassified Parvimonas]|uniref:DNA primase n=1 Tax=unclassified Parvimonas TaxID=1151464 RepID=UPI002B4A39C3|nr:MULTISPECIES: DNA primase [unclassified Parvimonas]MEB3024646.1 DNA primase [Parvimonas sp. M13]MEB3088791.1 DNA primase [Parvimonas sp. M20]